MTDSTPAAAVLPHVDPFDVAEDQERFDTALARVEAATRLQRVQQQHARRHAPGDVFETHRAWCVGLDVLDAAVAEALRARIALHARIRTLMFTVRALQARDPNLSG